MSGPICRRTVARPGTERITACDGCVMIFSNESSPREPSTGRKLGLPRKALPGIGPPSLPVRERFADELFCLRVETRLAEVALHKRQSLPPRDQLRGHLIQRRQVFDAAVARAETGEAARSEEHTSELQSRF